ncbi:hypothetical protein [uncultured Amnibacterium sp.]|uniref:hypothetical protein n=1 Tax=uncultured Amnibacterium sp. TaxID=1631851 RepID=UPI0035C948D2
MAVAAVLSIVWITFTFGAMILVAIAILVGALIGRYVSGELDVSGIVNAVRGRRSSS